jgi:hypothetical protein
MFSRSPPPLFRLRQGNDFWSAEPMRMMCFAAAAIGLALATPVPAFAATDAVSTLD